MIQTALAAALALASSFAAAAPSPAPVVVELYQSQGCSSCPPANAYVNRIADRPDVLALSFGVTYWDQLGWKDRFASPANTQRQRAYADAIRREALFTPEIVLNGRTHVTGFNQAKYDAAITAAARDQKAVPVTVSTTSVEVGAGPVRQPADVWLVRYDPRTVDVPIRAGENGGRTLPHRNVVRQLIKLGRYDGRPISFALPAAPQPGLKTAALVQAGPGGALIGAGRG